MTSQKAVIAQLVPRNETVRKKQLFDTAECSDCISFV
jgi:hypothetical protein